MLYYIHNTLQVYGLPKTKLWQKKKELTFRLKLRITCKNGKFEMKAINYDITTVLTTYYLHYLFLIIYITLCYYPIFIIMTWWNKYIYYTVHLTWLLIFYYYKKNTMLQNKDLYMISILIVYKWGCHCQVVNMKKQTIITSITNTL